MSTCMKPDNGLGIKAWAEEDRPREKLLNKGRAHLTNAELLAILINSGTKEHNAVAIAKQMLALANHNLNELAKLSLEELLRIKGIGKARAITIVAALELGRRRKEAEFLDKPKIKSAQDVVTEMKSHLQDLPHEEMWLLMLNRANEVIKKAKVSQGGWVETTIDPRVIFKLALDAFACNIILVHNHPSGNVNPSRADYQATQQVKEAGKILSIKLVDHVIYTEQKYYSFAEEGDL